MNLDELDKRHIWHPFTQAKTAMSPTLIKRARGAYLEDDSGKQYLDMVSSWWVNMHGHAHQYIAEAIYKQALTLEQVIFADFTHEPAIKLASALCGLLPPNLQRVFFSDNGSTAVEVGLKMAVQYWHNQGKSRNKFIAFADGYHGDTFGSMSVGKSSNFFKPFQNMLFDVDFFSYPATWFGDDTAEVKEANVLAAIKEYILKNNGEVAGLIIEPLVQGAGGFNMCRPEFMRALVELCRSNKILVIFDEIMTGFGRTGGMFACLTADVAPDIICLSKGLTGGFLPLSVTVTSNEIYEQFFGDTFDKAFAHGHSYTANPLGCAAALASLELFSREHTLEKIKTIEQTHTSRVKELATKVDKIKKPRVVGAIAAMNIGDENSSYVSSVGGVLKQKFLQNNIILRPLGNVLYLMPPYCITVQELNSVYNVIERVVLSLEI